MWHNLKTDPPKLSGQYITIIDDGIEDAFAEVSHYFKKGEYITTRKSTKCTPEQRMYDSLFNDELKAYADKDGFYKIENFNPVWEKVLNDNPYYDVYWCEMPEPPKGRVWGRIGSDIL